MDEEKLTPWQRYKKNLGETRPWDLLKIDAPKATNPVADYRLNLCKSCTHYIKTTHQCKKCGCIMNLKVKLADAECPIGKWQKAVGDERESL
jgi:hypothetical protein